MAQQITVHDRDKDQYPKGEFVEYEGKIMKVAAVYKVSFDQHRITLVDAMLCPECDTPHVIPQGMGKRCQCGYYLRNL